LRSSLLILTICLVHDTQVQVLAEEACLQNEPSQSMLEALSL
jgi:hypothetical protein